MDAKPKSNKQKRLENDRKREVRDARRVQKGTDDSPAARAFRAERALKEANSLRRDPERLIRLASQGASVRVPVTSDLYPIVRLFEGIDTGKPDRYPLRPDTAALRRLVLLCRDRTDLLVGRDASRYADALLALSAHHGDWVRPADDWHPRSHNAYRQFHDLVRHLVAVYEVPTFLNTAWLEGLTAAGVVHQRWFLHVAQGRNIRTADGLPMPLTRKQAHLYLRAPDDFDAVSAFRWAQVLDMGGEERLVRSILATRVGTTFEHDGFWATAFRWLVGQPMLDPVHHGPVIDFLHDQKFVASVPNPDAGSPGQPRLIPPQANLTMKGRDADALLRSVTRWHRGLGRHNSGTVVHWEPTGIEPFRYVEGKGDGSRVYTIAELLSSRELDEEGRAMGHCVGSYARSCASGRVSIWTLRVVDFFGQETRLLTLEIANQGRQIIQARRKHNKTPDPKEVSVLRRWSLAGGPALSKWLAG